MGKSGWLVSGVGSISIRGREEGKRRSHTKNLWRRRKKKRIDLGIREEKDPCLVVVERTKKGRKRRRFFALPATAFPYNPKAKNRELGDDNRMCLSKPQRVISTWVYF